MICAASMNKTEMSMMIVKDQGVNSFCVCFLSAWVCFKRQKRTDRNGCKDCNVNDYVFILMIAVTKLGVEGNAEFYSKH